MYPSLLLISLASAGAKSEDFLFMVVGSLIFSTDTSDSSGVTVSRQDGLEIVLKNSALHVLPFACNASLCIKEHCRLYLCRQINVGNEIFIQAKPCLSD